MKQILKKMTKFTLVVLSLLLLVVTIYGTTVVKDKAGANTIIPVQAKDIQLVSNTINFSAEKPPSNEEISSNVDIYRGYARVKSEFVLKNIGEEPSLFVAAFAINDTDQINEITVNNQIYTPKDIEVDRLTNYYEDGFELSGEYNVSSQQIVDRIYNSMTDNTDNYITGEWQRVMLIEMTIEPGKMGRFTIDYLEQSGVSRRGNTAVSAVPWEPEFYYYFDFYKFFNAVEEININLRLPSGYEIEHISYEGYTEKADNVYAITIEEIPKSNLIFTVHDPLNIPKDTGLLTTMSLAVTLMIGSGIILVLLVLFLVMINLVLPKLKLKQQNKAATKLKESIMKGDETPADQTGLEEENSGDPDLLEDALDLVDSMNEETNEEVTEETNEEVTEEATEETNDAMREESVEGPRDALEIVDEYKEQIQKNHGEELASRPDDASQVTQKKDKKSIVQSLKGVITGIGVGFKKLFSSKKESALDGKTMEKSLENALAADLEEMIRYESGNNKKIVFEPESFEEPEEEIEEVEELVELEPEEEIEEPVELEPEEEIEEPVELEPEEEIEEVEEPVELEPEEEIEEVEEPVELEPEEEIEEVEEPVELEPEEEIEEPVELEEEEVEEEEVEEEEVEEEDEIESSHDHEKDADIASSMLDAMFGGSRKKDDDEVTEQQDGEPLAEAKKKTLEKEVANLLDNINFEEE